MVSIFKTTIASQQDADSMRPLLNSLLQDCTWTIDLSDCDRILRVDSCEDKNEEIISLLNSKGFLCLELATFYAEP